MEGEEMNRDVRWMTAMELATRYSVSVHSLEMWRRYEGFPKEAVIRDGIRLMFDCELTDAWLRGRRVSKHGWRPKWLETVQHPMAGVGV
jgi:hypothetical protein